MVFRKADGHRLEDTEDLEAAGIRNFSVRFTLLPMNVDKMVLYGGIVPVGRDELREKVVECDADLDSQFIPTLAMKLMFVRGKLQNGFPLDLLPVEKADDRFGFGHLPMLEAIGSRDPKLPEHEDLEEQLCLFMRKVSGTNKVSPQRLESMLMSENFPSSVTGNVAFMWPEFRGPVEDGQTNVARNVTGV